jgi:hypothetical protein
MKGVWIATMDSEHYEWTAVGKTKDEAVDAIVKEWQEGKGHERRDEMTKEELHEYYGINCQFIEFGKCNWE